MSLNKTCSSVPPPVLTPSGFAGRFHRHLHGDFFVLGDFVKINVQHFAVERMMLDFLHEREALGAGVVFDGQIHEQIFRNGMVQQVGKFLGVDFQILRRGLAAVNGGGHAAGRAEFFDFGALHLRTRIRLSMRQISFS